MSTVHVQCTMYCSLKKSKYLVNKHFSNFSFVESSEDYINDDDEPAPFVIMPPLSNNTKVNTACTCNYITNSSFHVLFSGFN